MMLIMQGLNFIQIFLYQFKETKPKTFSKGKGDDIVISEVATFFVRKYPHNSLASISRYKKHSSLRIPKNTWQKKNISVFYKEFQCI